MPLAFVMPELRDRRGGELRDRPQGQLVAPFGFVPDGTSYHLLSRSARLV
jgi:hypothetical protein